MTSCTAKVRGHTGESRQAIDECPVHGSRGHGRAMRASAVPPAQTSPIAVSRMSDAQWEDTCRTAWERLDGNDSLESAEGFEYIADALESASRERRVLDTDAFRAAVQSGTTVFHDAEIHGDLSAADLAGITITDSIILGSVVLGERTVLSDCTVRGDVTTPGSCADQRLSWGAPGHKSDAILSGVRVEGNMTLDGTAATWVIGGDVKGDMRLRAGNGLQGMDVRDTSVQGVIYADDSPSIQLVNGADGNVIALYGALQTAMSGDSASMRYHGTSEPDQVAIASYDDLPDDDFASFDYSAADRKVDALAAQLRAQFPQEA